MLDVTDNELTVTVRVPEDRWLWLVSLRASLSFAEWSPFTPVTYICGSQLEYITCLSGHPPSQVHHGRSSRDSLNTKP